MGKFSNTTTFTGLLERATSQLQLEPDWASILQICDCVRQQDVSPKFAVSAIKKKMFDRNPHVSKFALTVLEACVKNCGAAFHDEIGTKDFMEDMRNLIKNGPEPVRDTALGLIQAWSHAFRSESKYKIIQDTYNLMKMEGFQFPTLKESDAMFAADCAPAWAEGDVCHMCRVKFGTFLRQHHCRNCGQVFCKKCSSKESIIPQYGIEREVRVCDPCYFKLNPKSKTAQADKSDKSDKSQDSDLPPEYLNSALSKESQVPPKLDPQQIKEQEEEELQLAMALSLSQEEAQKEKPLARSWSSGYSRASNGTSSPSSSKKSPSKMYSSPMYEDVEADSSDVDPDLARYLNRSYWESRKEQQSSGYTPPSAPVAQADDRTSSPPAPYSNHSKQRMITKGKKKKRNDQKYKDKSNKILEKTSSKSVVREQEPTNEDEENSETLVNSLRTSVEMLAERMQTLTSKGKHVLMDSTVQSLYHTVGAMHPQLLRLIEQQEEETSKYEAIQKRLGLVKDARVSLEAAREQHREKVRQQELEQDMLRRMQIEQKLELMRQQKAEYLAYQQRLQAERQLALEQQHQQLKYQQNIPQQYGPQYLVADGGSPYSSLGYIPASNMPPPVGVTQADGSPYSSMNYVPTSVVPSSTSAGPTAPGGLNQVGERAQQSYGQPAPQFQPGYAPQGYPGVVDNSSTQAPPSYSQAEYAPYGSEVTDTQSLSNGHPASEYQRQKGQEVPYSGYQTQQPYVSPLSSAPMLSQAQSQFYAQAGSHPQQQQQQQQQEQQQLPSYEGNQQFVPPQSQQPPHTSYGNQPQPAMQPYQQPPVGGLQADSGGYPSLQMQQQPSQIQQQQPPLQGQPPQIQGQPPQIQGQPPQVQGQPPQMQQQPAQMQQQPPQMQGQPPQMQGPPPQMQGQLPQMQGQSPQMQGQPPQMHQQPPQMHQQPQMQGQPPQMHQQPPQMQGQPPQMHQQPPQIQQQSNNPGSYASPQPQMYEPQSQQYQASDPYQQHLQQHPPSGPPPQRQLSDLQLISFD